MAESVENLADLFFSRLKTAPNAGVVLAQFYGAVMDIDVGRSEIILLSKLVKLFGKTSVFFSIIDVSRIDTPIEFPYGLLFKICKTKLENSLQVDIAMASMQSLERTITDLEKDILKVKSMNIEKARKFLEDK